MRRALVLISAALIGAAGAVAFAATRGSHSDRPAGTPIPAGTAAADFALRDQNGRLVRLSSQRGHFVYVTFLYTHCHDVCPLIASWLDEAARGHDVRVLAVSVDPDGDTPTAARRFVRDRHLGPEFHFLTGTRAQLAPVWQAYNVLVEARNIMLVSHAAPVFLLDRSGRPRLYYAPPQNGPEFAHDLRRLHA
jgi:protein SCO1